ncbi:hypothetical protein HYH03_001702 [Edaphochlamys debaryana]|uniref:phytol kinase n=1 Tax=Edaphochlamys debaryana TaxID=47281 RepID=A0A835YK93_9CHLO|nr:hypothetical protein HYH03_001702 [Edaphochlamys debaryana]|eukprot:KAG2500120.1 hypothetical protein HYH03_001702 [Edaphochlamys debaryana]
MEEAAELSVGTLAEAAAFARRISYAQYLTSGLAGIDTRVSALKAVEAAPFVYRFTGARFFWTDAATQQELSEAEAQRRMRRAERSRDARSSDLESSLEIADGVDPQAYDSLTADELALILFVLRCIRLFGGYKTGFELGRRLYATLAVRRRIQEVLLPALAAMDVGEPHHMTAPQWETVWIETLSNDMFYTLRAEPQGSQSHAVAAASLLSIARRLPSLVPDRAMSYRVPLDVDMEMGLHDELARPGPFARHLAPPPLGAAPAVTLDPWRGSDQGNSFAVAIGSWIRAHALLHRPLRQRPAGLTLGAVRALVAQAREAGKRVKRQHLEPLVKQKTSLPMAAVKASLEHMAGLPDSTPLQQPVAVSRTQLQQAAAVAAAATERGCDGCGRCFTKYFNCGGCRQRRYCSRACQVADWRGGHKAACKQMAEEAAEATGEAKAKGGAERGT